MNSGDSIEHIPPHMALAAVGFVGAGEAMDDLLYTLRESLEKLASSGDKPVPPDLAKAIEITKSIHVLHHKSIRASHALLTALIQELTEKP